jgi:2-C-methyl-D-erythritol 4-phosphate cytidylyltransferase/2-C-methyl-D-erythritol 2,4-cyclodiphosphate synthase
MSAPGGTIAALIVAAGRGVRAGGGVPKQYRPLGGRAVLARSVAAFADHPRIGPVLVVIGPGDGPLFAAHVGRHVETVPGAESRAGSVRAGLAALAGRGVGRVLIHDGARPLVSAALIDRVIDALEDGPAAAPALPVTDALWRGVEGEVLATQPRDGLFRAQTPQGFHFEAIRAAPCGACGGCCRRCYRGARRRASGAYRRGRRGQSETDRGGGFHAGREIAGRGPRHPCRHRL